MKSFPLGHYITIPHGIMLNPTRAWTTVLSTGNKDSEPEYG